MRAIMTVVGKDRVGIIAEVSALLAKSNVNILDISQTILQEYFTMMMLVDVENLNIKLIDFRKQVDELASRLGMSITLQHEEVFQAMHRIDKGTGYDS